MANTANDLAKDVGLELRIIDPTEDLDSEQLTKLTTRSRRIHASLSRRKVCYWDYDDIPDEVYEELVLYLAACSGPLFGKAVIDEGLDAARTKNARLRALMAVSVRPYTGSVMKATYY